MVDGATLDQLLEQLRQLHLAQGRVLQALESTIAVVEHEAHTDVATNVIPTAAVSTVAISEPTFQVGQQVYITNRITHIVTRRVTEADRTATVTHFTSTGRVGICTRNGFKTNRHPKHLRAL